MRSQYGKYLPLNSGFPGSSVGKESACNARDPGLIPGSGRDRLPTPVFLGFAGGSASKESCNVGDRKFSPWVGKIPWRRERLPTPMLWAGEFHGLYILWGCRESDTTEQLSFHFTRLFTRFFISQGRHSSDPEEPSTTAASGKSIPTLGK